MAWTWGTDTLPANACSNTTPQSQSQTIITRGIRGCNDEFGTVSVHANQLGFGMHKQGLPSDGWVDRFGEWMQSQGWMKK
jgi:hypothetical protein